ncbi:MAG TPA: hypothetical protein VHZ24_02370 [Pirellulales bacterium]|jgi:hypothetical protein|nr:hypothetical protein [Pirellulales bacterium]
MTRSLLANWSVDRDAVAAVVYPALLGLDRPDSPYLEVFAAAGKLEPELFVAWKL